MTAAEGLTRRLRRVALLVCDVDGVLTDGTIWVDAHGGEGKGFSVLDGTALVLARLAGLQAAFLTGRRSAVVRRRARECRVSLVAEGATDKGAAFSRLCRRAGVSEREAAFVGDDLIDLPAFTRAGLAIAVPNAVAEVRRRAHWVTRTPGGRGAVREIVERLLRAQGRWAPVVRRYLPDHVAED